jgi:hypothetical protein
MARRDRAARRACRGCAALFIVDGAFVKNRLERKMKDDRQRTLKIEGVPKVSLFPKLGLSFGRRRFPSARARRSSCRSSR